MSRNYNEYLSLDHAAATIAHEVIVHKCSARWCGSLEDLEQMQTILKPFNIVYVDDMSGKWALRKESK